MRSIVAVRRYASNSSYLPIQTFEPLAQGSDVGSAAAERLGGRRLRDERQRGEPDRRNQQGFLHGTVLSGARERECTPPGRSALIAPVPHGPGLRAPAPPPARRPAPRAAALRLSLPGDRGLPRRPGGPRRALPRPFQGLAPAVRGPDALPLRDGDGRRLRPRGAAAGPRPTARRQPHPLRRGGARPGARGPRQLPPLALSGRLRLGRDVRRPGPRPGVDPGELRPHAPRGTPALRPGGGGRDAGRHGRGRPLERRGPPVRGREPPGPRVRPPAARNPAHPCSLEETARPARRRPARPAGAGGAARQPPAGRGLPPPAGDRRDRGALLLRDRRRGVAVQGHGAAGPRDAGLARRFLRHVQRVGGRALRGDAGAPDGRHPEAVRAGACPLPAADRAPPRVGWPPRLRHARGRRAPQGRRQGPALLDRPPGGGAALPARAPRDEAARQVVHRHRGVAGRRRPRRTRGHRLRHRLGSGSRPHRHRDPAVPRPVARPGLAGSPPLRGRAAREPAAAPPGRRARHRPRCSTGRRPRCSPPGSRGWTRRRSCTPST